MDVRQADRIASVLITFEEEDLANIHIAAGANPVIEMPTDSVEKLLELLSLAFSQPKQEELAKDVRF